MSIGILTSIFLCTLMFSRLAVSLGAPAVVNFLHFAVLAVLALFIRVDISVPYAAKSVRLLAITFVLIFVSALLNEAGAINVMLEFFLIYEPYILFLLLISKKWNSKSIRQLNLVIVGIVALHTSLAYVQKYIIGFEADDVEGLLLNMGAGSHLAGAISLTFSLYFLNYKNSLINRNYTRLIISGLSSYVVIMADAKQVVAVFLTSTLLMIFININDFRKMIVYSALSVISIVSMFVLTRTVFPELGVWARVDLIQEGIFQKSQVVIILMGHYESFLHMMYGLGPGHTAGRLAMMLPAYEGILGHLGATTNPITYEIWLVQQAHHISNSTAGSSMFSLFFSWAGIFGDLGFLGVIAYLLIWYRTWSLFNGDELSRFILVTILVFGGVYGWLEEPQYMLFVFTILALRFHQAQLNTTTTKSLEVDGLELHQRQYPLTQ